MTLSYRQHQLVIAFVFLAKRREGGAKLSELAGALDLADSSTSVRRLVDILESCHLIHKTRMTAEPRAPWRLWTHPDAWLCAGSLTYEDWRKR